MSSPPGWLVALRTPHTPRNETGIWRNKTDDRT